MQTSLVEHCDDSFQRGRIGVSLSLPTSSCPASAAKNHAKLRLQIPGEEVVVHLAVVLHESVELCY